MNKPASCANAPRRALEWNALPRAAQVYVAAVIAAGAVAFAVIFPTHLDRPILFLALLIIGCVMSTWKVNLPAALGNGSTLSVSYSVDLMALLLLGVGPATLIALAGVWTQCTLKVKQPYPLYRTAFSAAQEALTMSATAAAYTALGGVLPPGTIVEVARAVVGAITVYFLVNTLLVAAAMALSTRESIAAVWRDNFLWSAPSFIVAGGAGAFAAVLVTRGDHWMAVLLAAPAYLTYRTYQVFHESMRTLAHVRIAERALAAEKERLAVVLGNVGDGVVAADAEHGITVLNRAAEALTGWSEREAIGRPLPDVYRIVESGTGQSPAAVLDATGGAPPVAYTRRATLLTRDLRERPIEDVVTPLTDGAGRPSGTVIAFRDVTDRIRAQEEQERAGRLSSLGVLAGGIAHDFNNILAAIMGNVSLVRVRLSGIKEADASLDQAEQACVRARQLTQQLLTFARGGAPLKRPLRLGPLLQESARIALSGSNVRMVSAIDPGLWALDADEGQLVQVFQNLLLNARQAMADGGTVDVRAENLAEQEARSAHGGMMKAGPYVLVSIADHGAGIPEGLLRRVFEPYFTTKPKGSGLGLATAYSIVTNHGGFIDVDSTVGRGTVVRVRLPALLSASVEGPSMTNAPARAGKGRVLVLDDDESVRDVIWHMLHELGYECEAVSIGEEAIAKYAGALTSGSPFDIVLLDLTIPGGMGGTDVLRELRRIDGDVRAIVASGYAREGVMARYREHGFRGIVTKPFSLQELQEVLDRVLSEQGEASGRSEASGFQR